MPDHRIKLQVELECPPYICVWSEEQYTVLCILSGVSHALIKANVYVYMLSVRTYPRRPRLFGGHEIHGAHICTGRISSEEIGAFLFYAARTLISSQKF